MKIVIAISYGIFVFLSFLVTGQAIWDTKGSPIHYLTVVCCLILMWCVWFGAEYIADKYFGDDK